MTLIFGLEFDDHVIPTFAESGTYCCGKKGLLNLLESYLGLNGHPDDIDFLRIEQYRQCLLRLLQDQTQTATADLFFHKSFEADQFSTATDLLSRRDELKLAGWDFQIEEKTPPRLHIMTTLEKLLSDDPLLTTLSPGYAERFSAVLSMIDKRTLPFTEIYLNEPKELLPPHFQMLFDKPGITAQVKQLSKSNDFRPVGETDLHQFQKRLQQNSNVFSGEKQKAKGDGSLLLLRAKRSTEAATYIAKLLSLNPDFRPACIIPEKNRTLDMAIINEGLPSLGIPSSSYARPTLQILKLATVFLWQPIDPFKILEFASLPVKPLADDLAHEIAIQISRSPGIQGEGWYSMIKKYFDEQESMEDSEQAHSINIAGIRKQYNFWFERQRYDMDKTVPKSQALEIFSYLRKWALMAFEELNSKNNSLIVLSEQAKRITNLLDALPESELTHLELERIVRTIYEPSPVVFREREAAHLPYVIHPAGMAGPVDAVLWWNFIQNEPPHFFSRWYGPERNYLKSKGINLSTPEVENTLQLWQQVRPILLTQNRLILVIPERVNGEEVQAHPLLADIQATFETLEPLTIHLNNNIGQEILEKYFECPKKIALKNRRLGNPKAFIKIRPLDKLEREHETYTSLESLFYSPYQWVFRHKLKLNKSTILSVVNENTLKGNLAHRVFEKLLVQDIYRLSQESLENWVEIEMRKLLAREGAVLLMYGREPERVAFVNKLKFACWSLICHIRENGWKVRQTEMSLEGDFPFTPDNASDKTPIKGIADLVLERGDETAVIDIKWRGTRYREENIRNEEDLQLVLYSRLLSSPEQWTHTAFYIVSQGKLIARNNLAFKKVIPVAADTDHQEVNQRILSKMEKTWEWRMNQLSKGIIEVRTKKTEKEIEETYTKEEPAGQMMELLEIEGKEPFYNDYKTLLNLIE